MIGRKRSTKILRKEANLPLQGTGIKEQQSDTTPWGCVALSINAAISPSRLWKGDLLPQYFWVTLRKMMLISRLEDR